MVFHKALKENGAHSLQSSRILPLMSAPCNEATNGKRDTTSKSTLLMCLDREKTTWTGTYVGDDTKLGDEAILERVVLELRHHRYANDDRPKRRRTVGPKNAFMTTSHNLF